MYLLGKRVDKLTPDDIIRLVKGKIQENRSLDYKRDLNLNQDKDKKEFLFDISSMANTEGGCLVFGIEESKDEKNRNTGTPMAIVGLAIDNYDKLIQQIEDLIRGNTEPALSNIGLKLLTIETKNVLVIGVEKNLGLPCMVIFNDTNKFYRRRNSGKYTVDVYELNQMFMQNLALKRNAEEFRNQRILNIRSRKIFPNIETRTSFFIHIIPYSFQNERVLDIAKADEMQLSLLMIPMHVNGWDKMFNVDGYATWATARTNVIKSYDQLFRNGIYEIYTSILFSELPQLNKTLLGMSGNSFIPDVLEKINSAILVLRRFQIEPPFIIALSFVGVQGGIIYSNTSYSQPFLQDEIYLPPIVVPSFESNVYEYLKPVFDIIWQSVSQNQSPAYFAT